MRRRDFIKVVGGSAVNWPLAARAQQQPMPVMAFLKSTTPDDSAHLVRAFRQGLSEAGFVEGRNVAIEYRWAENQLDRLPELVWRSGRPGVEPVRLSNQISDTSGKKLEFLREIVPSLRRLAILANPGNPAVLPDVVETQAAARKLGLEVTTSEVRRAEDITPAFDALVEAHADALYVCTDPLLNTYRIRVNTLALAARLPTIHGLREYVEAGGLMSYGPNLPDLLRRAADFADKILRGAKPAGIPVEQPTKFDLVINLTTAKALGLNVPQSLIARADEVIE
jgi:putative tryptophan/tyrosine transport system substrate-binding protein